MEKKKIPINEMPKGFRAFFVLLPLLGTVLILLGAALDNDFYFLYPTGEYIVNNGFPTTDILSMHSSMGIIVQQWLSTVIFYFVYSKLGLFGMTALLEICYLAIMYLSYKLCLKITDNFFISAVCAMAIDFLLAAVFIVTRPQVFTYIIILLELYFLESFVKDGKIRWLIPLPLLSVLIINLHSSMWLMLFVFAAPYAVSAIPFKFGKFRQEPSCSFIKLLIAGIICLAAGFINPYGIKSMLYIFSSFGKSEINSIILEMQPLSFGNTSGYLFTAVIAVMAIIAVVYKGRFSTRFVLLFAGTLLLGVMNIKGLSYFLIAGIPSFAYYISDINPSVTITENKRTKKDKIKIIALSSMIVILVGVIGVYAASPNMQSNEESEYESTLTQLDEAIEILDKAEDDIVLYAGFDCGNYLEFKGYHPYLDGRAELFIDKNNGEYNYLKEYGELMNSTL